MTEEAFYPLRGIRVVDLGHAGVGPLAGALLADLGAEVIKVEPPAGEIIHQIPPRHGGMATLYLVLNLGKKLVILDLKKDADKAVFHELIRSADIYTANWRVGAAERIGIDYASLSQINPQLVYVNSSGFGATGPLRDMGSYNSYGEAIAGGAYLNGRDGQPELSRNPGAIDVITALRMVEGAMLGLLRRKMTGKGCEIVTSQMESAVSFLETRFLECQFSKVDWYRLPHHLVSGSYRASDGWFAIGVRSADEWAAFRALARIGEASWTDEIAFARYWEEEGGPAVVELFAQQPKAHWVHELRAAGLTAGPMMSLDDIVAERTEAVVRLHTRWGSLNCGTTSDVFDGLPMGGRRADPDGPYPGQHNEDVLREVIAAGYQPKRWTGAAARGF